MNRILMWLVLGWLVYRLLQQQKALQQANARIGVIEQSLGAKITTSDLDYRLQHNTAGTVTVTQAGLDPFDYKTAYLNFTN